MRTLPLVIYLERWRNALSKKSVRDWLGTHWLAACCILAPLIFAFWAPDQAAYFLDSGAHKIKVSYQFPSVASDVSLLALDLRGRTLYAIASAFLYLASASAILFGFVVVWRRNGTLIAFLALLFFAVLGWVVAPHATAMENLRPLVVERILYAASLQPDARLLASTGNDVSVFARLVLSLFGVDQGPGATALGLLRLNAVTGLISVGMLLSALASVSVLRSEEEWTREQKLQDLRSRRMIIRLVLALGSVVLVVSVIASTLLIEWPTSLLIESQQIAIAPLGEALNLLFAASGTLGLIAAIGPALIAYLLDRHELVKGASKASQRPETSAMVKRSPIKRRQIEDDLSFAPLSSISGVIALFAPLMTPSVMELIKIAVGVRL
jgi:uncharacterized membrane protein YidH (DUF202 family)